MKTKKLLSPCIHMNGTGKDSLVDEYDNAWHAIEAAIEEMRKITVNGRDYYPYEDIDGDQAIYIAQAQHRDRMLRLENVQAEIAALIVNLTKDVREQFVKCEVTK